MLGHSKVRFWYIVAGFAFLMFDSLSAQECTIVSDREVIDLSPTATYLIDHPPFKTPDEIDLSQTVRYDLIKEELQTNDIINKHFWVTIRLCNEGTTDTHGYLHFGVFDRIFLYQYEGGTLTLVQRMGAFYKKELPPDAPTNYHFPITLSVGQEYEVSVMMSTGLFNAMLQIPFVAEYVPTTTFAAHKEHYDILFYKGILMLIVLTIVGAIGLLCVIHFMIYRHLSALAFSQICFSIFFYFLRQEDYYFDDIVFWAHWGEYVQKTEVLLRGYVFVSFLWYTHVTFDLGKHTKWTRRLSYMAASVALLDGIIHFYKIHPWRHFTTFDDTMFLLNIAMMCLTSFAILGLMWWRHTPYARIYVYGTALFVVFNYTSMLFVMKFPSKFHHFLSGDIISIYGTGLFLAFMAYLTFRRIMDHQSDMVARSVQLEQQEEISRMRSRLFTNITHEFRTPITVINGLVSQTDIAPRIKDTILANSSNLLHMVDQMIEIATTDIKDRRIRYPVDLVDFVKILSEVVKYEVSSSDGMEIKFYSQLQELSVMEDRDALATVIFDMIKYGDSVHVSADSIQIVLSVNMERDMYRVEMHYQPDADEPQPPAVISTQIQKMEGQIEIISDDSGSMIAIELPLVTAAPIGQLSTLSQPTLAQSVEALSLDRQTILIVEDNRDLLSYLTTLLVEDYHVITAKDGMEGCQVAAKVIPDIILTDLMMPGTDGGDMISHLRQDQHTSHIPIIVLTARADQVSRSHHLGLGADAYLTKPFDAEELRVRLQSILANRAKLQAYYQATKRTKSSAIDQDFLLQVKRLIQESIADTNFSVTRICADLEMERTQVYRKVKALTGCSPSELIRQIRMQQAWRLIKESDKSIGEISQDCGFKDTSYFSRAFKKHFGTAPSEVRSY